MTTVEGVLQRCDGGVSVFDAVVCPPSNPFCIQRHNSVYPFDNLIEVEGVFKKRKYIFNALCCK